jgi:hypothetical protein
MGDWLSDQDPFVFLFRDRIARADYNQFLRSLNIMLTFVAGLLLQSKRDRTWMSMLCLGSNEYDKLRTFTSGTTSN